MAEPYVGFTKECIGGAMMVAATDLGLDVALESEPDLKKKNLSKLYKRGSETITSAFVNILGDSKEKGSKFTEGVFYASLPLSILSGYHYLQS